MAETGTPILGDGKYGGREAFLDLDGYDKRLHLHARAIHLPHPDGSDLTVEAPLPSHMKQTMTLLGLEADPRGLTGFF
jgi:23S rRNA pseudouridine955/2504/2580 synthase